MQNQPLEGCIHGNMEVETQSRRISVGKRRLDDGRAQVHQELPLDPRDGDLCRLGRQQRDRECLGDSSEARLYLIQLDAPNILCSILNDESKLDSTEGLVEVHQIIRVLASLCGYVFAQLPKVFTGGFASFGVEGGVLERFLGIMIACNNGLQESVPKAHDHRLFLNILTEINHGTAKCQRR